MFDVRGLAVSLPLEDLGGWLPPASIYSVHEIKQLQLHSPLAAALALIIECCGQAGTTPVFIARPEMFTHGELLRWLASKLNGIQDHLNLSNGSTLRVIPDMRNHAFFYGTGLLSTASAFARLQRRAPELLASLTSQLWTTYSIAGSYGCIPTRVAFLPSARPASGAQFWGFCYRPEEKDHGAALIEQKGLLQAPPAGPLLYIPLTEAACADEGFMREVSVRTIRGFFAKEGSVVIRMPELAATTGVQSRLGHTLRAISQASGLMPRSFTHRVLLTDVDLDPKRNGGSASPVSLLLHHSFEVWRHDRDFYRQARTATIYLETVPSLYGDPLRVALEHVIAAKHFVTNDAPSRQLSIAE